MRKTAVSLIIIIALAALVPVLAGCGASGTPSASATPTYANVTVAGAMTLIARNAGSPNFVILDVRTPAEYADGHIAGAVNIDLNSGTFDTEIVKQDSSKKYLVYCRTGQRSAAASSKMVHFGFTDVTNMTGGITDWIAAGYPTFK